MRVTILGCGSSAGVPVIGCNCSVCTSSNPKNNRTRVSVYVECDNHRILIDTSPDLRQQALRNQIHRIDTILYTHDHADHVHGLDDLRAFNHLRGDSLPIYATQETIELIQKHFPYAFLPKPDIWFRPSLLPNVLPDVPVHPFSVGDVAVTMFEQRHGKTKTLGYRIGNFSYSTDTNFLPESTFEILKGTEIWVVDCLRYSQSFSHADLKMTLGWIERVKPRLAILTHMAHDFDYDALLAELPAGVIPGYDGIVFEL